MQLDRASNEFGGARSVFRGGEARVWSMCGRTRCVRGPLQCGQNRRPQHSILRGKPSSDGKSNVPSSEIFPSTSIDTAAIESDRRWTRSENVSPGQYTPICYRCDENDTSEKISLECFRWGLAPSYLKTIADDNAWAPGMFNARSETILEKGMFARLVERKRCIAFIDGFYEWVTRGSKRKIPYYVTLGTGEPMMLAALWDEWNDPGSDAVLRTYTILTMDSAEANIGSPTWSSSGPLHNRMPIVLDNVGARIWLNVNDTNGAEALSSVINLGKSPDFRTWQVTERMNSLQYQKKDCALDVQKSAENLKNWFSPKGISAAIKKEKLSPSRKTSATVDSSSNFKRQKLEHIAIQRPDVQKMPCLSADLQSLVNGECITEKQAWAMMVESTPSMTHGDVKLDRRARVRAPKVTTKPATKEQQQGNQTSIKSFFGK